MSEDRDRALDRVRLLSASEVAEALGLRESTVRHWSRARRYNFPPPVRLGQEAAFKWRLCDVEAFVARLLRHPPPPRVFRGGRKLTGGDAKPKRVKIAKPTTGQADGEEGTS